MSDTADQAQATTEMMLDLALRSRKPVEQEPTGYCRNCDETLVAGKFCDADCRDDWTKRHNTQPARRA